MPLRVWAYLIHHKVVVTLVPIAILQGGRKPERPSQERERLDQALSSAPQDPSQPRDPIFSRTSLLVDQHHTLQAATQPSG